MNDNGFKSIDDLIDRLSRGGEYEFRFHGKMYSLLPIGPAYDYNGRYIEECICMGEQYTDDELWTYATLEEVPEFTTADGCKLKDIIHEIEVTFATI